MRPEILIHPNLPPELEHLNPRKMNKKKWWTDERKIAEYNSDECCMVCGIHKTEQRFKKYLEGHELCDIDYDNRVVKLKEVTVLCNLCHSFIHIGNVVRKYKEGLVSGGYLFVTLDKGVKLLSKHKLKPNAKQAIHWLIYIKDYSLEQAIEYVVKKGIAKTRREIDLDMEWSYVNA